MVKADSNWKAHLRKRRRSTSKPLKKVSSSDQPRLTRCLALDCEMVGVGSGGHRSALAHVVVVNELCETVYSNYVKPQEEVTDYRTRWSGVTAENLQNAVSFSQCQREVNSLISNRVVVGHDLQHDFRALGLSHPRSLIRDTAKYKYFQRGMPSTSTPKLQMLAAKFLKLNIQSGEHDPAEDASAAMKLFLKFKKQWEGDLLKKSENSKTKKEEDPKS
ncbi:hypothetical protein P9112_007319 [Eukaryota sp. TZLM1-RC]